jgi:hypothetical protein
MVQGVGVDNETFITLIPTFPPQGGRRVKVIDLIVIGTSPECEEFLSPPKGRLKYSV